MTHKVTGVFPPPPSLHFHAKFYSIFVLRFNFFVSFLFLSENRQLLYFYLNICSVLFFLSFSPYALMFKTINFFTQVVAENGEVLSSSRKSTNIISKMKNENWIRYKKSWMWIPSLFICLFSQYYCHWFSSIEYFSLNENQLFLSIYFNKR